MVIFSVSFLFAYPARPYLRRHVSNVEANPPETQSDGGVMGLKALADAVIISDLLSAIVTAPARLTHGRSMAQYRLVGLGASVKP